MVLSSITGARLLVQPIPLSESAGALLFLALAAVGIVFQFAMLSAPRVPAK